MWKRFAVLLIASSVPCRLATSQTVPIVGLGVPDSAVTMKLGDGTLRGERIEPHEMTWRAIFHPRNGAPIKGGIWNEQVLSTELNGRKALVRMACGVVYSHTTFEIRGFIAHTTVVDAETLAPIWSEHRDPDGTTEKWLFDGTRVEVHKTAPGTAAKETVTRFDTGTPAYDFTGPMFPFYFKALPLKVGYSGVIPAVGDAEHPLKGVRFTVVRREKVKAGARGMVDAWVVESIHPGQTDAIRFWISDGDSFPIRMELMGDPREVYEMID